MNGLFFFLAWIFLKLRLFSLIYFGQMGEISLGKENGRSKQEWIELKGGKCPGMEREIRLGTPLRGGECIRSEN